MATAKVNDGQGVALPAVAGPELTLEVARPDLIGSGCLGQRRQGGSRGRPTGLSSRHQASSLQDIADCARRRPLDLGELVLQARTKLERTPGRMLRLSSTNWASTASGVR
jgi:hypothetical protein